MADFLAQKRAEIDSRLKELRPLHDEFLKLEQAVRALEGVADEPVARRGPGRPRGGSSSVRRRSRRNGTRAQQALEVVRQHPGVTVSELGDRLGVTQKNYLYRVMANLEADGAVEKQGRGYAAL